MQLWVFRVMANYSDPALSINPLAELTKEELPPHTKLRKTGPPVGELKKAY